MKKLQLFSLKNNFKRNPYCYTMNQFYKDQIVGNTTIQISLFYYNKNLF